MSTRIVVLLVALSAAAAAPTRATETCVTCHPDVKTEYERSVHVRQFGCTSCHGGDGTVATVDAHSTGKGFVGKPPRTDIPFLCASCHADVERMRASGLPTDQYALYQKSEHGGRLAAGDTQVAVCTDCHGVHGILSHTAPTSPVAARNVPATCAHCHSTPALMARYKLPTDQFEKFRSSVHGVALFADEHPSAPTCSSCHGAHGVSDGEIVTKACGKCHARTLGYVDQGAHRQAVAEGKMPECIGCHRYHDIAQPGEHLFDTACPTCHAADSPALTVAQELKTLLVQARESLATTRAEIDRLKPTSPTVARAGARLRQADAYLLEALPVQHALNVGRVEDLTRSARSMSDELRSALHGVDEEHRSRRLWLAVLWVYVLGVVIVILAYRAERRRDGMAGGRTPGQP